MTSPTFPGAIDATSRAGKRASVPAPRPKETDMVHRQRKAYGLWLAVWSFAMLSAAVMCAGCSATSATQAVQVER